MRKAWAIGYGVFAYAVTVFTFVAAIGFFSNHFVPKAVDSNFASSTSATEAASITAMSSESANLRAAASISSVSTYNLRSMFVNLFLFALCIGQQMAMRSRWFNRFFNRVSPAPIARSQYLMVSSMFICLMFLEWQSMGTTLWTTTNSNLKNILTGFSMAGWLMAITANFSMDHKAFMGLSQVVSYFTGKSYNETKFMKPTLYQWVRHPMLLGTAVGMWFTPTMTAGHALFALCASAYFVFTIRREETQLVKMHGGSYEKYQNQVPMIIPFPMERRNRKAA